MKCDDTEQEKSESATAADESSNDGDGISSFGLFVIFVVFGSIVGWIFFNHVTLEWR